MTIGGNGKKRRTSRVGQSFLEQRIALLDQPFKLFGLLRDAVRVSSFILGAGECSGLFNQLADVVTNDRDAAVRVQGAKANDRCS